MAATLPAKPAKPHPASTQCVVNDEVYVQHPKHGPMAVRISAAGTDGFTARCGAGAKHTLPWDSVLGHRRRITERLNVVDQGADGAIVADDKGRRRFLTGKLPTEQATKAEPAPRKDDPLLDGMGRLAKAQGTASSPRPLYASGTAAPLLQENVMVKAVRWDGPVLFLKAGQAVANRPGLMLRPVTDKLGHRTQRWTQTQKEQPKGRHPGKAEDQPAPDKAPMAHGDVVKFRHGDVEGSGKIVGSGADGVTVKDEAGTTHQVRHDALIGKHEQKPSAEQPQQAQAPAGGAGQGPVKPNYEPRQEGEEDHAYAKRVIDKGPTVTSLPEDHGKYFHTEGSENVPLDKLVSSKSAADNEQGGENGAKRMQAAYHGVIGKRGPIQTERQADGTHKVIDGNGTLESAKRLGWKTLPVSAKDAPAAAGAGAEPKPLFDEAQTKDLPKKAAQPAKDETGVYDLGTKGLDQLQEWLDRDKGIAIQAGAAMMNGSPEDADMSKPGPMLWIAPLKGKKRAAEKVQADYQGDWSKLLDVVRCSIACDTHEDVAAMLAKLQAGGMKLAQQPKDRFAKPLPAGYRDCLMNVTLPNGCVAEVQLHVKAMIAAKGEGHHFYETQRTLDAKPREQWSDADKAAWQAAQDKQVEIYGAAWQKATGGKATGTEMTKAMSAAKWEFREREGATFRRPAGQPGGMTHVFDEHGKKWADYTGDRTAAYQESDECADPMGGAGGGGNGGPDGGGEPLTKAQPLAIAPRVLFLKAQVGGAATRSLTGDLFEAPVQVAGHVRDGHYIAPFTSTRRKRPEPPPPMSDAEADQIARDVLAHHAKWRRGYGKNPPMTSPACWVSNWAGDAKRKLSDADETKILDRVFKLNTEAANALIAPKPKQAEGLAPHTPQPKNAVAAPAKAEPAALKPVPDGIKDKIARALAGLRSVQQGIEQGKETDRKFDGRGRYENDAHENRKAEREGAEALLAKIRARGKEIGADVEGAIAELGGEPDLTPSDAAREWQKPAPAPVDTGASDADKRQMLRDAVAIKKERGEAIPEGWTRNLAALEEKLGPDAPVQKEAPPPPVDRTGWSDAANRAFDLRQEWEKERIGMSPAALGAFKRKVRAVAKTIPETDDKAVMLIDAVTTKVWGVDYDPKVSDIEFAKPGAKPAPIVLIPKKTIEQKLEALKERRDPNGIEGAKHFYVSAIDGQRKHLVAGPYPTHEEALARVSDVRAHADYDPRAHFMAWGTAGSPDEHKTPLGAGWAPKAAGGGTDSAATLEANLARVQADIDNHHRPEELNPTNGQMDRYNTRLDALTAERREIKARIAALKDGGAQEREFASDIANRESAERFAILKQRQLDGVRSSLGRGGAA